MTLILGFIALVVGVMLGVALGVAYFTFIALLIIIALLIGLFVYLAGLSFPYNILLCVLYLFLLFGLARMIVSKK